MSEKKKINRIKPNKCCPPVKYTALNSCCCPPDDPPCLSLCDCCVSPLQSVLQQLVGETVILATIADAPNQQPLFFYTLLMK